MKTTFEVYDSKNKDRLLGSIKLNREFAKRSPHVNVPVMLDTPVPFYSRYAPPIEVAVSHVSFELAQTREREGDDPFNYTERVSTCALTDTPLEMLLKISDFTLPKESSSAAAQRRVLSRHSY